MTALMLALPALMLIAGFPIYLILFITALVMMAMTSGVATTIIQTSIFGSLDSFPLLAIPFFVLAGEIMGQGGIAKRILAWIIALVGGVRGSLALTTVATAEVFGTMSGSSVGCIAAVGRLLYPALRDNGYGQRFSASLIASSGAIAVIMPPSIPLIIYGVTAQQPITPLFLAGVLPALLIGAIDAAYVLWWARKHAVPLTDPARWANVWAATKDAAWALGTPAVIFGGIYGGIATPTEAAGIAVIYALFVSRYIYGDLTWPDLWRIARSSALVVTQILIIVAAAGVYSWFLTTSGLPQTVVAGIKALDMGVVGTLLLFNVLLLLVGSVLEPPAAILILTPLFMPIIT
ncbi:MAG: TRAP transporter large permease, partial [Rhodospirillales bacterium]|nr:TRAP transporter large permease [Rhodospirillales bacterium]